MDMKTSPLATLNDASLLKTDALINGEWVAGGARFDVHRPGHRQKLADVANLGPKRGRGRDRRRRTRPGRPGAPRPRKERSAILMKWFDAAAPACRRPGAAS